MDTDNGTMVGKFIEVPAWQTFGRVESEREPMLGPDGSIEILLCEHPDHPARLWRWYRLALSEWVYA